MITSHEIDLKKFCSYKIGGIGREAYFPQNAEECSLLIKKFNSENSEYFVMGNGANILFHEGDFTKKIINTSFILPEYKKVSQIVSENLYSSVLVDVCDDVDKNYQSRIDIIGDDAIIEVFAGEQLMTLIRSVAFFGFGGMEDLAGIPSSIGGAFKMNAGAFKHWFLDFVEEATFVDNDGSLIVLPREKMEFGYRTQKVLNKGSVLISCKVKLIRTDANIANAKIDEILSKRDAKQPLEFPSCGSVFKNITRADGSKLYAWQMIGELGLRGFKVGGAEISTKHTNFIVNTGNASSSDVKKIIEVVKQKVFEKYGESIETEVIIT